MFETFLGVWALNWFAAIFRGYTLENANLELEEELRITTAELGDARAILREIRDSTRTGDALPDSLAAKVEDCLASVELVNSKADNLVGQIDDLLRKGESVNAARRLRQDTGAIWDDIHGAISSWGGRSPAQKHAVISRFLRQRRTKKSETISRDSL